jgi:hypothetical protein
VLHARAGAAYACMRGMYRVQCYQSCMVSKALSTMGDDGVAQCPKSGDALALHICSTHCHACALTQPHVRHMASAASNNMCAVLTPLSLRLCCPAGIKAVVDALLLMYHLASTVEAPRKRRSVISLVLLWLGLLLACVWWIYGRR